MKKLEILAVCNPALADVSTQDCTSFTYHEREEVVHAISRHGLDVTMSTDNSIGQSFKRFTSQKVTAAFLIIHYVHHRHRRHVRLLKQ